MLEKSFLKNVLFKSTIRYTPFICIIVFFWLLSGVFGWSEINSIPAQSGDTNVSNTAINVPGGSKKTTRKIKPSPTASPIKVTYLKGREAAEFYNSYENALGADLLDFQTAYDKFFVSEPEVRQYLGRNALPGNLDVCSNVDGDECEKIIIQKISKSDLEKYYFLHMENKYFSKLLWLYTEIFDIAAQRGLYKLVKKDGYNGLQVVLDPQLLDEEESQKKSKQPIVIGEEIQRVENFNQKLKNHFHRLSEEHYFVKQILKEMRDEAKKKQNNKEEKTPISSQSYSGCKEKICLPFNNYYEVGDLKVYRADSSKQLKAFEIFFRMRLF